MPTLAPVPTSDPELTTAPPATPGPTSPVVPTTQPNSPAAISFSSRGHESDKFAPGAKVAWQTDLPGVTWHDDLWIFVYDATGELVHAWAEIIFDGTTSSRNATFDDPPGRYVMQYVLKGSVVAEGNYWIDGSLAVDPTSRPTRGPRATSGSNCDPSYPTLCLPSYPDLDCGDINARNFPVIGKDPHGFDADNDGIGCET